MKRKKKVENIFEINFKIERNFHETFNMRNFILEYNKFQPSLPPTLPHPPPLLQPFSIHTIHFNTCK